MVIAGFLFLSPWLFSFVRESARVDAWAIGIFLLALSGTAVLVFSNWEEVATLVLGVWLIIAPWPLGFLHTTAMHVSIGVGLVISYIALLDLWLIYYGPNADQTNRDQT
jgi:hypothetical protein